MENGFYCIRCRVIFVLLSLFLFNSSILAQGTGSLRGAILDKASGEPLIGANVVVQNTSLGAAADIYGNFYIHNVPAGTQRIIISYVGYNPVTLDITIQANQTLEGEYELSPRVLEGEEVVITGQAQGQLSAINQQLSSNTISNVVSKDRIKELPDVNAAETVGRLPGVSIQRSGGEATKISIRGLSPKYNLVTVNGVRLPSTGGNEISFDRNFVDVGSNDRSVDLSLISSNMMDGIVLKKANTPDMDADALGGTVDIRLREAPEDMQFNLAAQGGYNELQDYYGNYNFSGNISQRFFDSRLGIIASINTDKYDRSADKFSGEYRETNSGTEVFPERVILREETVTRKRSGGSILADYRIPAGKVTANAFYSYLSWDGLNRINNMTLTAPGESNRHYYDIEDRTGNTQLLTGSLSMDQNMGWIIYDASIARTSSETDAPDEYTWRFTQDAAAFANPNFPPGTDPKIVASAATTNPLLTKFSEVWKWSTQRRENETAVTLNFQIPLFINDNINGYIKTGGKARWLDRRNDVESSGRHGMQHGGATGNEMLLALDRANPEWGVREYVAENGFLPIVPFLDDYSRSNFLQGDFPLGYTTSLSMLQRATQVLEDSGYVLRYAIPSLGSDYYGIERYQAGYIMTELKLWKYFTLIPGVRYEQEYTRYNGWRFRETTPNNEQGPPSELTSLKSVRSHEYWLPMVHLIIEPTQWMKIRLAQTRTLTRPDFILITPTTRINSGQDYIRANNSKLKPSQSYNYDAAISVYENYTGLFTVSGFYKEVKDLIFQTSYRLFAGISIPDGANIPDSWRGSSPNTDLFINNPYKAIYKGFELDWQAHFWYLPSPLNGLVFNVNYTRIFSQIEKWVPSIKRDRMINPPPFVVWSYLVTDSSRTTRMPDQPAHILNLTLGYDMGGFSARLSYLYQTNKFSSIGNKSILDSFTGTYARWDLSLQQKIGWGLQAFANFTNLNSRPDESFSGDQFESPTYIEYYGFTMDIGVRYSFQ